MSFRHLFALALVPGVLALGGCGGPKKTNPATLYGQVTLNGEPVRGGAVTFHSNDAGAYSAAIDGEGNYRAVDLPVGELTVTVETEALNPNTKSVPYTGGGAAGAPKPAPTSGGGGMASGYAAMRGKSMGGGQSSGPPGKGYKSYVPEGAQIVKEGTYTKIPEVYRKKETSTLKITAEAGEQKKELAMTGK